MPKRRDRRPKPPKDDMSPQERERLIAGLLARFKRVHRVMVRNKWRLRQAKRAAGLPSIGLSLDPWPPITPPPPRYGRNNPLRYQESNQPPPCLDLNGSRL